MSLKQKILTLILLLTFLIILAMSVTYYNLFNKQIKDHSHTQVVTAFELVIDDLQNQSYETTAQIERFVQTSLTGPLYVLQLRQEQSAQADQALTVRDVRSLMPHISTLTNEIHKFGDLIGAAEVLVYNKHQQLLAAYQSHPEQPVVGGYLPQLFEESFIPIQPDDDWFTLLRTLEEVPQQSLPEGVDVTSHEAFPAATTVHITPKDGSLMLRFLSPIRQKDDIAGACLIHLALAQHDVERYSRLSNTRVNLFTNTTLSVGTLPEYHTLIVTESAARQTDDILKSSDLLSIALTENDIGGQSYYQGQLLLENEQQQTVGAITVHFPRELEAENRRSFVILIVAIMAIFGGIATGGAFLLSAIIARPLMGLTQLLRRLAQGDLTVEINATGKDEIQQVLSATQGMVDKLKEAIAAVKSASTEVAARSHALSATATEIAQEASRQAASAEEASASIEEMTANIRQNAENALQTEKIGIKAANDAGESGEAVMQSVSAMQQIASKIAIIEDIARQTRMLSLNAAIEAGRAQQEGKGFAVVAAEVRSLAERSQEAATEINQLVSSSVGVAEKAGSMLARLVPDIQKTAELVQEISAASREQSTGADQINSAIQQLDTTIQQNVLISENLSATAEKLASQAEQLRDAVEFFHL